MQLGMVGLGRMGANMTERLRAGRARREDATTRASSRTAGSLEELVHAARRAALGLADGPGRRSWTPSIGELAPHLDGGRHDHRRRQLVLRRRPAPLRRAQPARASTTSTSAPAAASGACERGYCLMVGGDDEAVGRLEPVFEALAPGRRRRRAHAGPQRRSRAGGAGLAALRPERRRPLREDGPQRDRVRADAGVRRGPERPRARERRRARAARPTPRRRRSATPSATATTSTSPPSPSSGGAAASIASWLLDLTALALHAEPRPRRATRAASPTPARAAGRCTPRSTSRCPPRCSPPRCSTRFASRGEADFATASSPRCATRFGGHLEKSPDMSEQ